MTGFGNSSFFYVKWDFSLVHVLQMFWRKTMTMAFLCFIRTRKRGAGGTDSSTVRAATTHCTQGLEFYLQTDIRFPMVPAGYTHHY